jgi:hypothetical protein
LRGKEVIAGGSEICRRKNSSQKISELPDEARQSYRNTVKCCKALLPEFLLMQLRRKHRLNGMNDGSRGEADQSEIVKSHSGPAFYRGKSLSG